jgi:hypothetical protein
MAFIRYLSEAELELMRRPGPLSRRHREMLGVRVSALNGCTY